VKDYYASMKIRNGRLLQAMREMGMENQNTLAHAAGVQPTLVSNYLNFKRSPRREDGAFRKDALRIAEALAYSPYEIFPEHLDHEVETNEIGAFVEQAQLKGMIEQQPALPGESTEIDNAIIDEVLSELTEREEKIIRARFWEDRSLESIAEDLGITRERVRQLESKAFRKLRHPSRKRKLRGHKIVDNNFKYPVKWWR